MVVGGGEGGVCCHLLSKIALMARVVRRMPRCVPPAKIRQRTQRQLLFTQLLVKVPVWGSSMTLDTATEKDLGRHLEALEG